MCGEPSITSPVPAEAPAVVLVVDDEKSIRLTLSAFLQSAGHTVYCAASAAEADALALRHAIDVAIVDILIGPDNGLDVSAGIIERRPNTQIVLMTGEPEVKSARRAIHLHAFDYLAKPVGKEVVIDITRRAAVEKRRRDACDRAQDQQERYRQELETEVAKRTRQLQMLAEIAADLVAFPPDGDIHDFVCRSARDLVGCGIVAANAVDEDENRVVVRAVCGLNRTAERAVTRTIGRPVPGLTLDGIPAKAAEALLSGHLVKVEGGIHEMLFGKMPHAVCNLIGRALGVDEVYSIGLRREGKVLGNFTIMVPSGTALQNNVIETLAHQVSIALERRQSEKARDDRLQELRRWQAVSLNREGRILDLKREVNDLLTKSGESVRYASAIDDAAAEDGDGGPSPAGNGQ